MTLIEKTDAARCARNRLAMLRGRLDRDTFLATTRPDSVIRVPCLAWPSAPRVLVTAWMVPPSVKYSALLRSSMSISKDVSSPVDPLIVSTRIFLAMPNPANFPIPFRPMARRPERVLGPRRPARRSYPTLIYSSWHSSNVMPCPLSSTTIVESSPSASGSLMSTAVASASHPLATSSASDATGLWYI